MKSLVIYDSQYGNTRKIAEAIGRSISAKVINTKEAKIDDLKDIELLVIGSPTQGGRPTIAIQNFLKELPNLKELKVAAFDTRFKEENLNFALKLLVKTIGYAAPKISKILEENGGKLIAPPEGFIVTAKGGPLAEDEIDRASKWLL